jgi:hypothetical protein
MSLILVRAAGMSSAINRADVWDFIGYGTAPTRKLFTGYSRSFSE